MPSKSYPVKFTPKGICNAWDATEKFPGACLQLKNLIFDQSNPEQVVMRPGVGSALVNLASLISGATFISVYVCIGDIIFGMVNSSLNAGKDQPFAYNIATSSLISIANITNANTPTSQSSIGDWVPPTMAMVGSTIVVTHTGFAGGLNFANFTGAITGSELTVSALTSGAVSIGQTLATVASVPIGTSIIGFLNGTYGGNGIYLLNNSFSSPVSAEAMSSSGYTQFGIINLSNPSAPFWDATTTGVNNLPSIPTAVANFNNRAYFACGNASYFSDVLIPTNMAQAGQALAHGDTTPITGYGGLPIQTTSAGVIGALIAFKQFQVWQITGDEAVTGSLAQSYLSLNVGTNSPRSIVQTPAGMIFIGIDGPYYVTPLGQVLPLTNNANSLVPDLQQPFQNLTTPTRAVAAFTGAVYRVCLETVLQGVAQTNDYWFDVTNRRWNGPHTFPYDCASYSGDYFLLSGAGSGAKIFTSDYIERENSVYTDNGSFLSFTLQPCFLPKTSNINQKQVVESTIELCNTGSTQLYYLTAQDESFNTIGSATIQTPVSDSPITYAVPWDAPLVFKKLSIIITGVSGFNSEIGTMFFKYQDCGYTINYSNIELNNVPSTPAGVVVTPGYDSNTLSWLASFGANSYNIYFSISIVKCPPHW